LPDYNIEAVGDALHAIASDHQHRKIVLTEMQKLENWGLMRLLSLRCPG